MTYELYLITNNITGKRYVGQTLSEIGYLNRFKQHCGDAFTEWDVKKSRSILHASIRKYGVDAFSVKRLLKEIPEDKIDFYERLWIYKLNTFYKNGMGYNMTLGGQGVHGYKHSDETKKRLSDILKGRSISDETIQKRKETSEKNHSMERRSKNPSWRKNVKEAAKKRSEIYPNPFKGRTHTQEVKNIISEKNSKPVAMLDKESGEVIQVFPSLAKASEYVIEIGRTTNKNAFARISKICNGIDKSAYGYGWNFVEKCND